MLQWWSPGTCSQPCILWDDGCCSETWIHAGSSPEGDWVKLPNHPFFVVFNSLSIHPPRSEDWILQYFCCCFDLMEHWEKILPQFLLNLEIPSNILVMKFLVQRMPASLLAAWSPCLPPAAWAHERPILLELSWAPELSKNRDQKPDSGAIPKSIAQESPTGIFLHPWNVVGVEQMVAASELDLAVSCTNNHMYSHRDLV